jgi:threonine/homoserine/homoserine lactone efflux protein
MQSFLPFLLFAFVASITPGPTNILVMTNSSRHGLVRTLPIMLGGCAGAALLVLIVGTGLGEVLARHAQVQTVMSWIGIAWLTWLAWQISARPPKPSMLTKPAKARALACGVLPVCKWSTRKPG